MARKRRTGQLSGVSGDFTVIVGPTVSCHRSKPGREPGQPALAITITCSAPF